MNNKTIHNLFIIFYFYKVLQLNYINEDNNLVKMLPFYY
jgi:hypothetical protein